MTTDHDLAERLVALHRGGIAPTDDTVAADLRRGRTAARRRRNRSLTVSAVGVLGVAAVTTVVVAGTGTGGAASPRAGGATTHSPDPRSTASPHLQHRTAAAAHLQLVDYTGTQVRGFTVDKVPQGYVLQGGNAAVLDVTKPGDHTDVNTFIDKVVVSLLSTDGTFEKTGAKVEVNGHVGYIQGGGSATTLTWDDGTHVLQIQQWSTISLTRDQLVEFAEGVHVTKDAVQPHG